MHWLDIWIWLSGASSNAMLVPVGILLELSPSLREMLAGLVILPCSEEVSVSRSGRKWVSCPQIFPWSVSTGGRCLTSWQGACSLQGAVSFQSLLMMSPEQRRLASLNSRTEEHEEEEAKVKPYTLEEFSYEHFRYIYPCALQLPIQFLPEPLTSWKSCCFFNQQLHVIVLKPVLVIASHSIFHVMEMTLVVTPLAVPYLQWSRGHSEGRPLLSWWAMRYCSSQDFRHIQMQIRVGTNLQVAT